MEHFVQFAINIDDETIKKRVEDHAYDEIIDKLFKDAKASLPQKANFGNSHSAVNWRYLIENRLNAFIEENKEEVLDVAADKLCEAFKRTKAFKDKMSEAIE